MPIGGKLVLKGVENMQPREARACKRVTACSSSSTADPWLRNFAGGEPVGVTKKKSKKHKAAKAVKEAEEEAEEEQQQGQVAPGQPREWHCCTLVP